MYNAPRAYTSHHLTLPHTASHESHTSHTDGTPGCLHTAGTYAQSAHAATPNHTAASKRNAPPRYPAPCDLRLQSFTCARAPRWLLIPQTAESTIDDVVALYRMASFPPNDDADAIVIANAFRDAGNDNLKKLQALTDAEAWQLWPFKTSGVTGPGQYKQFEATVYACVPG